MDREKQYDPNDWFDEEYVDELIAKGYTDDEIMDAVGLEDDDGAWISEHEAKIWLQEQRVLFALNNKHNSCMSL